MIRILMIILLLVSTLAVVAHGILVYRLSATTTLIAEEETSHEKPLCKETKELTHEKITAQLNLYGQSLVKTMYKAAQNRAFRCSKGFCKIPYNPPDTI